MSKSEVISIQSFGDFLKGSELAVFGKSGTVYKGKLKEVDENPKTGGIPFIVLEREPNIGVTGVSGTQQGYSEIYRIGVLDVEAIKTRICPQTPETKGTADA